MNQRSWVRVFRESFSPESNYYFVYFIAFFFIFLNYEVKQRANIYRKYTEQKKKGILNLVLNYAFFI